MSELRCEDLPGRLRDICRGHDEQGNPVLTPEKCEKYRDFFINGQFKADHSNAAAVFEEKATGVKVTPIHKSGPEAWKLLHSYPVENAETWDEAKAQEWYKTWLRKVPSYGCSCRSHWKAYTKDTPPPLLAAQGFFEWSVVAHNHVSTHHAEPRKEAISLQQAAKMYNAPWSYNDA